MRTTAEVLGRPRWRGEPHRLEVWYATWTDLDTGSGYWFHVENVAPDRGADPHTLGWFAVFARDAKPRLERFGPYPLASPGAALSRDAWVDVAGDSGAVTVGDGVMRGRAGSISWDLTYQDESPPLYTFPEAVWRKQLLPAAQVVPAPAAHIAGSVTIDENEIVLRRGLGGISRIYGHGNAQRWAWLHADLGGGDVLEMVTASARRPPLRRLAPLASLQLRIDGVDWPRNPLLAAPLFRTRLGLPGWSVSGTIGRSRLRVDVDMPSERCVAVGYRDPDGAAAVCTNTERADALITYERYQRGRWVTWRQWSLAGTAHAELGRRADDPGIDDALLPPDFVPVTQ
ncbi:MAG: hypothetical protein JJLCMIEE_02888 [Acidimicrobiales bacterium]|nr:MAG: hypothetical protein EDR02_14990 [Actinomycetota bacterium]MBV6509789.1 hypothetical protein [Acidimicrobiales bacterium]RIK04389.1 MAG: hypothetical protein DCC48_13495 [Acidobacteriota bacterium]